AAVGALPVAGSPEAAAAAAALPPIVPQPIEAYRAGRDDPIEERRLTNLYYRALLLQQQQDTPIAAAKVPEPTNIEIERTIDEIREQPALPDARGKFDRNLEDYIVLRKDDPRAIYLRDHLLLLEQQAARDAAAAAATASAAATTAAATTVAPSHDASPIGEGIVRVSTEPPSPFSHDEQPRMLKGTAADLPTPLKARNDDKEDVIAEFLEQQRLEAASKKKRLLEEQKLDEADRAAEKVAELQQAEIRKQLIAQQQQKQQQKEDAAAESQQE
ncbi:hypothetical protein PENTCL1PPCAC_4060, partial [Pristionchus entomophagus]